MRAFSYLSKTYPKNPAHLATFPLNSCKKIQKQEIKKGPSRYRDSPVLAINFWPLSSELSLYFFYFGGPFLGQFGQMRPYFCFRELGFSCFILHYAFNLVKQFFEPLLV